MDFKFPVMNFKDFKLLLFKLVDFKHFIKNASL